MMQLQFGHRWLFCARCVSFTWTGTITVFFISSLFLVVQAKASPTGLWLLLLLLLLLPGVNAVRGHAKTMAVRLNKSRAAGLICLVLTVRLQNPHRTSFNTRHQVPETSRGAPVPTN